MNLLKFMRETPVLKYLLWIVIISFVLAIFVLWGGGLDAERRGSVFSADYAVKAGDNSMPQGCLRLSYQLYHDRMQSLFGSQFKESYLKGSVQNLANQMVGTLIMEDIAKDFGLRVSDAELADAIAKTFHFQDPKEDYPAMLGRRGVSADEFERYFRSDLLVGKLYDLLADAQYMSDETLKQLYHEQNDKYKAMVAFAKAADFTSKVPAPTEADLQAAYAQKKSSLTVEEKRSIRYVSVNPMDVRSALPVTDAEIKAYYDIHKEQFGGKPFDAVKAQARQAYLFTSPAVKDRADKAFKDATAAIKDANGDAAISAAAAKFGLKVQSSPKPFAKTEPAGDLGQSDALSKAVFEAAKDKWSDPLDLRGGIVRFCVTEITPAHPATFAEARGGLEKQIKDDRALAAARAAAMAAASAAKDATSLEAEAKKLSLATAQTGELAAKDFIPAAGVADLKAGKALMSAPIGKVVGPLELKGGFLVAVVTEQKPADMAQFAKDHDQFSRQQAQETVTRILDEAVARRRKALEDKKAIDINMGLVRQMDPASVPNEE